MVKEGRKTAWLFLATLVTTISICFQVAISVNAATTGRAEGRHGLKESVKNVSPTPISTDGPSNLPISWIPALYKTFDNQGNYGNFDLANRPTDGLKINYIVIHNTETSFDDALNLFKTPTYTSANYLISSQDGQVAEMVQPKDVAWHAGNWYINAHSIGIEHEGYATVGGFWYTKAMYQSSAALVKYLAAQYNIPLDRQHIIGHDNVPGLTKANQKKMHWDPGTYWDWEYYFKLLGIDFRQSSGNGQILTITPDSDHNLQVASGQKVTDKGVELPLEGSNFVYLYQKPSFDSPLLSDANYTAKLAGSTEKDDWTDKAVMGQQFVKVDQDGDWTAINYAGQKAWFYNPDNANTTSASGKIATVMGSKPVPVYGAAYPDTKLLKAKKATGTTTAQVLYQLKPGQKYVVGDQVGADYFNSHFNSNSAKNVIRENKSFDQIQVNHRIGFVNAKDVSVTVVR